MSRFASQSHAASANLLGEVGLGAISLNALQILSFVFRFLMYTVIDNSKLLPKQGKPLRLAWCLEETTDLVDYIYEHRGQISRGTFKDVARHLDQKYPHRSRSDNAVHSRFQLVSTLSHQTA